MTEEHKQHMREAVVRRFAAMDAEKLAAFKEKCAANGRKSWAVRSEADKAEQIARINTPEVRKRASDANKAMHQAKTEEERIAYSARHKARWLHPTESVEAERRARSERSKRLAAAWTPEQRAAFAEAGQRAHRKPVEGTPVDGVGEVVRFDSAGSAAQWVLSTVGGKSFATTRHTIYEALAGRRETAYGFIWRHAATSSPRNCLPCLHGDH